MKNDIKIGCITVLYNPDYNVLTRITSYPMSMNSIILVDNSKKENPTLFQGLSSNIKYVPLNDNTGVAHAMNVGIKILEDDCDYILTMDQDSNPTETLLDVYKKYIRDHSSGIYALTPQYNTDRRPSRPIESNEKVLLSMQSGTLFNAKLFQTIGYFNEDLFLDVVDWEYFLRMNRLGYNLIRCNNAILNHQPAETHEKQILFKKVKYGVAPPIRYYYQARNLLWTARKYNSKELYKNLAVKLLKILFLFENKRDYLSAFNKGILDAKKGRLGCYDGEFR